MFYLCRNILMDWFALILSVLMRKNNSNEIDCSVMTRSEINFLTHYLYVMNLLNTPYESHFSINVEHVDACGCTRTNHC